MPKSDPTSAQISETLAFVEQQAKQSLTASLAAMLGDDSLQAENTIAQAGLDDLLWFQQEFVLPESGQIFLGLERAAALAIGHKLLAASGLEGEDDETALGTFQEVLGQVGGALASSFSVRLKKDVSAGKLSQQAPPSPAANTIGIQLRTSSQALGTVLVFPALSLLNALVVQSPEGTKVPAVASVPSAPPPNTRNLDLLLDVEMPVSVSFGRAQLPLKEVIKLTTGSIVELDRTVSEPVEIIVNNAVIAQGEVVVVDGNFGVRITQILSKQDRLRSLG